jgi:hypothetical protein
MAQQKTVLITLNDLVREYSNTIELEYDRFREIIPLPEKYDRFIFDNPLDDYYGISNEFEFQSKGELEDFLYDHHAFHIFKSNQINIGTFQRLYSRIITEGYNCIILIESRNTIMQVATMQFLSTSNVTAKKFHFVYNLSEAHKIGNILITKNKYALERFKNFKRFKVYDNYDDFEKNHLTEKSRLHKNGVYGLLGSNVIDNIDGNMELDVKNKETILSKLKRLL